jgi:hypothetical protein
VGPKSDRERLWYTFAGSRRASHGARTLDSFNRKNANNISDNELTGREGNFERRVRFVHGLELEGSRSYAPMGVKL